MLKQEENIVIVIHSDEYKAKAVSASYNSINVINESNDSDEVDRNVDHIKIMMAKDWFVETLTKEQKKELENVIK